MNIDTDGNLIINFTKKEKKLLVEELTLEKELENIIYGYERRLLNKTIPDGRIIIKLEYLGRVDVGFLYLTFNDGSDIYVKPSTRLKRPVKKDFKKQLGVEL